MEELRNLTLEAFLSLPRRGAEIGGLLLGRFHPGNPATVSIDALESVPCQYRYGPSYTLSDEDRQQLRELLGRARPEGSPTIVGFYRSYTRRDAIPDAADADLFKTFLPDDRCALLLIEPLSVNECFATFVFRNGGELPSVPPYAFFALDPGTMQRNEDQVLPAAEGDAPATGPAIAGEPALSAALPPPAPVLLPSLPPARRTHPDEAATEPEPASAPRRRFWLPLVAGIAVAASAAVGYEFWKTVREPQWAELRLDAGESGGEIQLTWDRSAPAVAMASRGVLRVTDGPARKVIELTAADLHAGKLSYRPSHPDVLFRMDLHGTRVRPWSDSLRVLSMAGPAPAPAAASPAAVPPAPVRAAVGEASRSVLPPAKTEAARAHTTPAVAIHEVQPEIPEGIRSRITTRLVIPVDVRVSEAGMVVAAIPRHQGNGVYSYLADAAAKAAHSWRFTPAKSKDGKPVASRKTIQFAFGPGGEP